MQGLLPDIREVSEFYIFQQDSAPAHRARETVELLTNLTPDFISPTLWPPNSPDLNPDSFSSFSFYFFYLFLISYSVLVLGHYRSRSPFENSTPADDVEVADNGSRRLCLLSVIVWEVRGALYQLGAVPGDGWTQSKTLYFVAYRSSALHI